MYGKKPYIGTATEMTPLFRSGDNLTNENEENTMATLTADSSQALSRESSAKKARLEFRSTPAQKSIIERAASLLGESVTSFVLSTVLGKAEKVIHEHQITVLSMRDWDLFQEIVEKEVAPNERLLEALAQYEEQVVHSDGL